MRTRLPLLCCTLVLLPTAIHAASLHWPRMPSPQLAPTATGARFMTGADVRQQLQSVLPPQTVFVQDIGSPANKSGAPGSTSDDKEAPLVAATLGYHPIIELADTKYAALNAEHIPVLLDWLGAVATTMGHTPQQLFESGYRANKVALLLRVFTSVRMHRDNPKDAQVAPAIGFCRVLLLQDLAGHRKGESLSLVLIATDKGWFAIDPFSRRMRQLQLNDPIWAVSFVVI